MQKLKIKLESRDFFCPVSEFYVDFKSAIFIKEELVFLYEIGR